MRTVLCIALIATLPGCGVELLGATAIQGTMRKNELETSMKALNYAKDSTGEMQIQQAINTYAAEKGAYPPSLDALVPQWLPEIPTKGDGSPFGYNPATGQVLDKPMPAAALTPVPAGKSDAQKMEEIRQAIVAYGTATGYYPMTLDQLVPDYLSEVPKTAGGKDFIYDGRNLGHPNPQALQQSAPHAANPNQQPQRRGAPVGGSGPMGEVMTGIAIQQDLNSMSSAGSSAAGSRMRHKARNMGQNRDQQVNQQMKDLGL